MSIWQKTLQLTGNCSWCPPLAAACANALLPQDCLLCGALSWQRPLCAACYADLPPLPAPRCPQCATPTPNGEICGRCLRAPPAFDAAFAPWRYDFPLDRLVQALKYNGRLALSGLFADALAQVLPEDFRADLLLPVPLHPQKLSERGFNQALEIAKPLAVARGLHLSSDKVVRQRHTPSQTTLPWGQRAANIKNAFLCHADLRGLRVALIDDVLTSGATASELARTLKLHGAAHVTVLAVARALKD